MNNKHIANNLGCIYAVLKTSDPTTIKIGSSEKFYDRVMAYITPEPWFDNNSHKIWKFDITKSPISCYQIDKKIMNDSKTKNIPYEYLHGTGGKEHYKYNNDEMRNLCNYLDDINIKYTMTLIDIDNIKLLTGSKNSNKNIRIINNLKNIKPFECKICHKTFETNGNLSRHLNKKIPCVPCNEEKYKCQICGKHFSQKSHYNNHVNRKIPCKPQSVILTQDQYDNLKYNRQYSDNNADT
jgi:uncharacterized C2H2 Zn-finger protein